MSFFVTETPKRSNYLAETLAPALGQSLGKMTTSYFANKELEKIISDKELQKKPLSERMEALMRLDKFGPVGQEIVQRRLGLEQQRAQEQEQAKALKGRIALAQQFGLPEEAVQGMTPDQITNAYKALNPQPKGGQTFQPIPPQYSNAMAKIRQENPKATAAELEEMYNEAAIPPGYIKTAIETKRRDEELTQKKKETADKRDIEIHKLSKDVDKDISEKSKSADRQLEAISTIRNQLKTGKIKPTSLGNALRGFGAIGDKLADAFLTKEQAAFAASIPSLIEGMKDLFGVRLSDADLKIVQDKLPGLGKDEEANEAILQVIEKYANISKERAKIGREIKKENQGLRPINYDDEVEERLDSWKQGKFGKESARIDVYDAQGNKIGDIDSSEVNQLPQGYTVR